MSEQEFEDYLILLSRFLGLSPDQRESIAEELRDHMHQRLEVLQRLGIPRNEAVREALAEFGDASRLASELSHLANRKQQKKEEVGDETYSRILGSRCCDSDGGDGNLARPGAGTGPCRRQSAGSLIQTRQRQPGQAGTTTTTSLEAATHERIRAALRRQEQLDFKDVTLTEMVEFLEKQLGVQIEIDKSGPEQYPD